MKFKEWEKTAKSSYTCYFGRGSSNVRDVYTFPNGVIVHHEIFMPRSIFQPQSEQTLVDILSPRDQIPYLEKLGMSRLDEDRYSEEGFGYPLICGEDSLERAWDFSNKILGKTKHLKGVQNDQRPVS